MFPRGHKFRIGVASEEKRLSGHRIREQLRLGTVCRESVGDDLFPLRRRGVGIPDERIGVVRVREVLVFYLDESREGRTVPAKYD